MRPSEARLLAIIREHERREAAAARKLHDDAGPALTAAGYHLRALKLNGPEQTEILIALESAMAATRDVSNILHTNVVEKSGLSFALEALVTSLRRQTPARIDLRCKLEFRPPAEVQYALYRLVLEALTNAIRHARSTAIEVSVIATETEFRAFVRDDGVGFEVAKATVSGAGIGLLQLESIARVENLQLDIESWPGKGTMVKIQTS
ncbi:MAG: hypothetical protein FJW30_08375 [Acidobacteria bacterium]|nr:hypothetical protein [Acidobacteriota bacterium]